MRLPPSDQFLLNHSAARQGDYFFPCLLSLTDEQLRWKSHLLVSDYLVSILSNIIITYWDFSYKYCALNLHFIRT